MSNEPEQASPPPLLSVMKGNPTPEEIAALVLVLACSSGVAPAPAQRASQWSAYWRSLHTPIAPGPGSWRRSARG